MSDGGDNSIRTTLGLLDNGHWPRFFVPTHAFFVFTFGLDLATSPGHVRRERFGLTDMLGFRVDRSSRKWH